MDVCNQLYIFIIAGLLTIFKKKHGLAFIMVILQMLFAFFIGMSKLPYLLYPFIKITDSHVNPEMGLSLVIVLFWFTFINSIVNIIIKICFRQSICGRKEIIRL